MKYNSATLMKIATGRDCNLRRAQPLSEYAAKTSLLNAAD